MPPRGVLLLVVAVAAVAADGGCPGDRFECDSGQCVRWTDKCDRVQDCEDHSDETAAACAQACPAGLFRCSAGACIAASRRCDGVSHCEDGSDECDEACPRVLVAPLAVGRSVAVRVTAASRHGGLVALACGSAACGWLWLWRHRRDRDALRFWPRAHCALRDWRACAGPAAEDSVYLLPGNLTLVLQRRRTQLAVWKADQPDNVGLVDAPDDALSVRVRPFDYDEDFQAELLWELPFGHNAPRNARFAGGATQGATAAVTAAPSASKGCLDTPQAGHTTAERRTPCGSAPLRGAATAKCPRLRFPGDLLAGPARDACAASRCGEQ